jgi:pseudouridine-5'-phosphate glycosidase
MVCDWNVYPGISLFPDVFVISLISTGMPFPQNVDTAREVEQIIRDHGATPATIAILDGVIHVGALAIYPG